MSGAITSSVGLISGINTSQIISELLSLDSQPVTQLQNQIVNNQNIQTAYADLQSRLQSLLTDINPLTLPSTFEAATATSSNTSVLNVTAPPSANPGSYTFTVARTVSTQSAISAGYGSTTAALGISGNITVGLGGGKVTSTTDLANLNGGNGVSRGQFRITDASGQSSAIDISSAVSLQDVVNDINSASNIQVKASIGKDGLVLQDTSGGSGTLKVANLGQSTTATDLGIAGSATAGTLTGTAINTIGSNTSLASLNDGLGIGTAGAGKPDLQISVGGGAAVSVSLAGVTTVGGVISAINAAGNGKFTAGVGSDGKSLTLTAAAGSSTAISVTSASGSQAASDLGLAGSGTGSIAGGDVIPALGSVLLKNLNGGAGLALGQLSLTDSAGNSASVLLSGDSSLSDVISSINSAGTGLVASVNSAGTGLQITDTSGGTGVNSISSSRGATATELGIAGTFAASGSITGTSLDHQYVGLNTALSDLNGGKGISSGQFTITTSAGKTATVTSTGSETLGQLIQAINGAGGLGVTASINSKGNGLLLTDTSGGTGTLSVKDVSGTAAANLNIAGTAAAGTNTIDGGYSKTIAIASTDSLSSIVSKLNQAGAGINASILNDGSPTNGNRLSISATNSGLDGQFTFDAGTTGLSLSTLTSAQNAAVFIGSSYSSNPVLLTSSSNTLTNVTGGLSLNLVSASATPVTVNVTQSSATAVSSIQQFVTDFNSLTAAVGTDTQFSTTAGQSGVLLGDATTQSITDSLFNAINSTITGAGSFDKFAQLGITVGSNNQLAFDPTVFQNAYNQDPSSLQRVFTAFSTVATTATTNASTGKVTTNTVTTPFGTASQGSTSGVDSNNNKYVTSTSLKGFGIAYQLQNAINALIDPINGTLVTQSASLDQQNAGFNDQITQLNTLLSAKQAQLEEQFANMETVLAGLQTQQTALNSLTSATTTTTSKSSS
jgi:flagellar hook-associated protein 2